jgi:hypothetical protein
MKTKLLKEGGQALILVAFAAIALFGITGLAIDGSHKYSDRRHAQNAADAAALAAARAKARGVGNWGMDGLDRALENGYDDDHVSNDVEIHNPPISGIYAVTNDPSFDPDDYVQVIITSRRDTWFMRVLGIDSFTNVVQAVASTRSEVNNFKFGGNAIVALSPDGCALKASGTTDVVINGGGMYSNSEDSCAFQKTTCSGSVDVNDKNGNTGVITSVGGAHYNTSCWDPTKATLSSGGIKQYAFPPAWQEIPAPAECSTPGTKSNDNSTDTTTLTPGYFDYLPPHGQTKKNLVLEPGVYCVGFSMDSSGLDSFTIKPGTYGDANGVFIYIKPGGGFTFNSSTSTTLWGINQAAVDANSSLSAYKGYLIYAAPNYSLDPSSLPNCKINGGSTSQYQGSIYAPYCNVFVNGNSGMVLNSQVIGYTVDLTGASGIILNYESDDQPYWTIPLQVGLIK